MKLTKRNQSIFLSISALALVVGTLAWFLLERIASMRGVEIDLNIGPVGFDLNAIEFWIRLNPGSFAGLIVGILVFRSMK